MKASTLQITVINSVSNNLEYLMDYLPAFRSRLGDYNVTQLLRLSVLVSWLDSLNLMPCFAWVYTCNTRATIISNEVQIPFHFMHFRISSVTDIIRLRAIIIKQ